MSPRSPTARTDTAWPRLAPLLPAVTPGGRPRPTARREVVQALVEASAAKYAQDEGITSRDCP